MRLQVVASVEIRPAIHEENEELTDMKDGSPDLFDLLTFPLCSC
jgi:hypothetical protein